MNEHDSVSTSRPSLYGKLVKFIGRFLATIALMPLHPLSGQTPWPSDPSRLNLQIRETLFSSRWGRQPSEAEISQAQDRVKQSVLLVEPVTTETRPDGTVVVAKRELLDISIAKKHALYLKPGEVGCGVNQVLLIAEFQTSEEITSPGKPSLNLQESYHSVFRLIASGDDRDRFEFQFEFSEPGKESETNSAEVFAERWYDFSALVVESTPRPVVPTVETEGNRGLKVCLTRRRRSVRLSCPPSASLSDGGTGFPAMSDGI